MINTTKKTSDEFLISVVVPTYNRAGILPFALKSAISQTYKNIEVIVVDDFSNDNTEEVVKAIQDPRIRYLCHTSNQGGAAARNTGIKASKGEYIAFLDSDDVWQPNKLEIQLNSIIQANVPERLVSYTQLVFCRSSMFVDKLDKYEYDETDVVPKRAKAKSETVADFLFCNEGRMMTSTLVVHREISLKTLFREDFKKHQDPDFCLRLEKNGAVFHFVPEPLTFWNRDSNLEHVNAIVDYQFSEYWLKECRPYFTDRAALAFYTKKILPELVKRKKRRLFVQKVLFSAFFQKLISPKKFVKSSLQVWG